jgi:hypothetical protein
MKLLITFLTLVLLFSCGEVGPQGPAGSSGPQGLPGTPGVNTPQLTTVQQIVANYNSYRESIGQEDLIPGLDCNLYTVPQTTTQIVGTTLTGVGSFEYLGVFNQSNASVTAGFNVLPLSMQPIYQTWFIMKCTGDLFVSDNNWHSFSLSSDDGSNLYISGLVINNDGVHGIQTVLASKYLDNLQPYSFELDFLQANGNQALILSEDGSIMSNQGFYH